MDNEMNFTEIPQSSIPIEQFPGGEYARQKTHGYFNKFKTYYNVSTAEVIDRIVVALIPKNSTFLTHVENNPDLYGPFWITVTVSFLCFAFGNVSLWLRRGSDYTYNFRSLVSTGTLLALFVFGFPFGIWFYKKALSPPLILMMTLLGYSLLYLVPGILLIVVFGIKLGFLLSIGVACAGAFSIFMKFDAYQSNSDRAKDTTLSILIAGVYVIVHVLVSFICFN